MKLRWTAPALRDLEALCDYIARDNPAAAAKTIRQILEQAEVLAAHPHTGRAGRVSGTRELVVSATPFIVPYRIRGEDVELLAMLHGAHQGPENFN